MISKVLQGIAWIIMLPWVIILPLLMGVEWMDLAQEVPYRAPIDEINARTQARWASYELSRS